MPNIRSRTQARSMEYYFWIEGVPEYCRWQDLKDLIRRVDEKVKWADVPLLPNGNARGIGCFRGSGEDAAWRVFEYLKSYRWHGARLRVHLFDITDQYGQPRHLACNCHPRQAAVHPSMDAPVAASVAQSRLWLVGHPSTMNQSVIYNTTITYIADPAVPAGPSYLPTPSSYSYLNQSSQAVYTTTVNGVPVNASRGTVRTEARGVILKQLSYRTKLTDVERLLRTVAVPVRCNIRLDSAGACRGSATAVFATSCDAQRVINALDGTTFMNRVIKVQSDTERTVVADTPVVADGSGMYLTA